MNLDIRPIVEQYPADCRPTRIAYLAGAGGFSGSQFWRLTTPRGTLALRCYAPGLTSLNRLCSNDGLLRLADQEPLGFRIPVPIRTRDGRPCCVRSDQLWDLCDWLPGHAVPEGSVTRDHIAAAMAALARFHGALDKHFPRDSEQQSLVSPAAAKRIGRIQDLRQGRWRTIIDQVAAAPDATPFWREAASKLAMWFNLEAERLATALGADSPRVPRSCCIGDIWRDNVLFDPQARVLSLIDFSKFEPDSSALDIARLLGSMIAGNPQWWHEGLAAYESVRAISRAERQLAILLDRANVLLSAWNWLEWLFVERRKFGDLHRVEERVRHFLTRLPEVFAGKAPQ